MARGRGKKKNAHTKKKEKKARIERQKARANRSNDAKSQAVAKARKAAQAARRGINAKRGIKVRTSVHFRRPKTLTLQRNGKYQRKSVAHRDRMNKYSVIKYPICTESAMKQIEDNNTLTFIVNLTASKRNIADAVKTLHAVGSSRLTPSSDLMAKRRLTSV